MSTSALLWTTGACAALGMCVAEAAAVGGSGLAGTIAAGGLGLGVVISSVAVVLTSRRGDADPAGDHGSGDEGSAAHSVLTPVAELSGAELGFEWVRTAGALRSPLAPATRDHLAGRRRELLEELERRDPGAVQRWLADGSAAGTDPSSYL